MFNQKNILGLCLIFLLNCSLGNTSTPMRQCADVENPLPLMVQIDDCNELPCELWKGAESNIAIQFVATRDTQRQLNAKVRLASLGMVVPYELDKSKSNVCSNLLYDAYCPLDAGEDVTYQLLLPVSEHQPELPTVLEVKLVDALDESVVACFLADTRIKRPSAKLI